MMIDLDRILFPEPVSAGLNVLVLCSLTYMYRGTNEHAPAVTVRREGDYLRLVDGRHRCIAAMMAGRKQILAEEQSNSPTE